MSNEFGINFDYPGFCANCHTAVAEFDGSDENGMPIVKKIKGNVRTVYFQLTSGSKLPVTVCDECELKLKGSDCQHIMESVINGWQKEIDFKCKDWSDEKKLDVMTTYSGLNVTQRVDKPFPAVELNDIGEVDSRNLKIRTR